MSDPDRDSEAGSRLLKSIDYKPNSLDGIEFIEVENSLINMGNESEESEPYGKVNIIEYSEFVEF